MYSNKRTSEGGGTVSLQVHNNLPYSYQTSADRKNSVSSHSYINFPRLDIHVHIIAPYSRGQRSLQTYNDDDVSFLPDCPSKGDLD